MSFWQGLGFVMVIFWPLTTAALGLLAALSVWLTLRVLCTLRRLLWERIERQRRIVRVAAALYFVVAPCLASCANTSDAPLTIIKQDTPIGPLEPDHLEYGELP
jgi:hypothetical protein